MNTSFRPMTARERAELEALVSKRAIAARAALFLLAVFAVGWTLSVAQALGSRLLERSTWPPFWLVPTLAFGFLLYARAGRWTGGRDLRNDVRRDLRRGEMAQHRVRVVAALEAPEVEDEGPVFFLREEDGATLAFSGQEMARHKRRGFPWRELEVVEAPQSRQYFRVRPLADSFDEVELRSPLTFEQAKALGLFTTTFRIVDIGWDELREDT